MRLALCIAHAGSRAYLDDGEMQDNSSIPCIDWKRDPWKVIKVSLEIRATNALAAMRTSAKDQGARPENIQPEKAP